MERRRRGQAKGERRQAAGAVSRSRKRRVEPAAGDGRLAQELMTVLFGGFPDPIWIQDGHYVITHVNETLCGLLGKTREEIVGRKCYEVLHGKRRPPRVCPCARVQRSGKPFHLMFYEPHLERSLDLTGIPLPSSGMHPAVLHVAKDVSEQRWAEEDLRKSNALLMEAQRLASLGSWEYDVATDRFAWSEEMYRLFRLDPRKREPSWKEHRRFIHPEDWPVLDAAFQRAMCEGKFQSREYRIVFPDGSVRWCWTRGRAERERGRIVRLQGTVQDITDRKRVERQLQNVARFPLENPSPVFRADVSGSILFANEAAYRFLGKLGGDEARTLDEEWKRFISEALRGGGVLQREVCSEGRVYSLSIVPIHDGKCVNVYGYDISERVQAETETRLSKEFIDKTMEESPFAMWISDASGTLIHSNRALRETVRLTDEQLIGRYNVFKDENLIAEGLMPTVKAVFSDLTPARFRMFWAGSRIRHADFSGALDRHIDVSFFPITDGRGKLTHVVCQWVDISERVEAERALKESEERYRVVADQTGQMLYDYDVASGQVRWFGAVEEITGCSHDAFQEVGIEGWAALIHADDRKRALDELEVAREAVSKYKVEYRLRRRDGSYGDIHEEGIFLPDAQGKAYRMLGSMWDITDRKVAEKQLKAYSEDLERMVEERTKELDRTRVDLFQTAKTASLGRMGAGIAHQLNSPLCGAMLLIDSLKQRVSGRAHEGELIDKIRTSLVSMRDIIEAMLSLAMVSRRDVPQEATIDLRTILGNITAMTRNDFEVKRIALVEEYAEDLPSIRAIAGELDQVFLNLINNAVDAMPGGGTLMVGTAFDGELLIVRISDTGCGIAPEHMGHVFDPFFTTRVTEGGVGLGLSLAHQIVQKYHGRISVESVVGQGTTFVVCLPIDQGSEKSSEGGA